MSMVEEAIRLTKVGFIVHPLTGPQSGGKSPGKRPIKKDWQKQTQPFNEKVMAEWWGENAKTEYNMGLVCGAASGVMVMDLDHELFVKELFDGVELNTLRSNRTKGRGHVFFEYDPELPSSKHHRLGIEILSDNNNAVLPPSTHVSGDVYKWADPSAPIQEMPEKLKKRLCELFELEKRVNGLIRQCRPCFKKVWKEKTDVHGADGRQMMLALCVELMAKVANSRDIHFVAKILYGKDYDPERTADELSNAKGNPWRCDTIGETLGAYVSYEDCEKCHVGKSQDKPPAQVPTTNISSPSGPATQVIPASPITEEEYNKGAEAIIDNKFVLDVPDSHFIAKYVAWAKTTTDAFQEYHIVGALWLLSSLCNGKPYVPLASDKVYLNLWLQIHGASTISRKSVAVNKAKKIYEAVTETIMANPDFSRDGLLRELSEYPVQATIRDESSSLLSKMHQKYNDGIFPMECQLYDRQSTKKTLAKAEDSIVVIDPYLTRIYAGTPETYTKIMCIEDFECGWGYRWLHIHPTYKRERRPLRMESEKDATLWAAALEQTKKQQIRFNNKAEFPMGFSPAALKMFQDITMKLENYAVDKNNSYFNGMIGRGNDQILKIAALYELGKDVQSFEIQIDSIVFATRFVIYCLDCELKIISDLLENIEINKVEKVLHAIKKSNGTITHSKLLQNVRMYKEDISKCLDVLIEGEMLEAQEVRAKNGKVARHYRLLVNKNDEINFKQIFGPSSFIDDIDVMHDIQIDKIDRLDRLDKIDELDTNNDTQKNESNLSNLKNPNVRQYDDVVYELSNPSNLSKVPSQYDHGTITMDLVNKWYPKRPANPTESRTYLVPEFVRQTGISPEAAHKHVIGAFKAKGWA